MKRAFFPILCTVFICFSISLQAQTLILDFETPATSDPFGLSADGFGGGVIDGVVADPVDPNNNVLSISKPIPSETWGGVATLVTPGLIDLTNDHEICLDFYEPDATGTLLVKLELSSNGGADWELLVNTTMGWNTYCVNTNLGTGAAGFIYEKFVLFPDFGQADSDNTYFLDNVFVNPIFCDLLVAPGTATCNAETAGVDTYDATFTFSQTTAPGAGSYTWTTSSGGTIGGDDPNMMTSGTITITGISEGTNADLNIVDGANCDINSTVTSASCNPPYDITFQVNMCEQINAGTFDPATQSVYVTGGNANQTGYYGSCGQAMIDPDGDNIYEITQTYPDQFLIVYKFFIGVPGDAGTDNCCCAGYEPNLPAPCGFGQFGDRQHAVSGMDETLTTVCYGGCTDCTSCTCDLLLMAGAANCDAGTNGVDTYEATFTFSQTAAPGAGTFNLMTNSGGIIGGDDPNTMMAGAITITGINEGVDADLNVSNGAECDLNVLVPTPNCVPPYNITFQVNMCEQINAGTFNPNTQAVYVAGGVNYPNCGAMMIDPDMDFVYELTNSYDDGTAVRYKYYIATPADANLGNCDDLGFEPPLVAPCNFGEFDDREIIVNGMDETIPPVCFGSCNDCTTCTCDLVLIAGTASCDANTSGVDTYTATYTFSQTTAPGAGTYMMMSNSGGMIGGDDPNTMMTGTITITGINEGMDADLNITDGANCNLDALVPTPNCVPPYNITFQVNMCEQIDAGTFDPATQAVFVAGGVNYPNCGAMMTDPDMDFVYELTNTYDDGTVVRYKYYIATPADANTGNCDDLGFEPPLTAPCNFGQFDDREFVVNGMDETIAPVCFGSCDDCMNCTTACPTDYAGMNQLTGTESGTANYETNGTIESDQTITATGVVDYDSATDINLLPGFETSLGALFHAFIDGCPSPRPEGDTPDGADTKTDGNTESMKKQ